MMKTGQGFSKVYAKSHADTSYYNVPGMMGGQMSATDLTAEPDGMSTAMGVRQQQRGNSAAGKRSRPMTAKVKL